MLQLIVLPQNVIWLTGQVLHRFLEDIADYLDEKGGYIITEQQLKGPSGVSKVEGARTDDNLDLAGIQAAFDRPKIKPKDVNINLFLGCERQHMSCCPRIQRESRVEGGDTLAGPSKSERKDF